MAEVLRKMKNEILRGMIFFGEYSVRNALKHYLASRIVSKKRPSFLQRC